MECQHSGHPQEKPDQPGRQWRYGSEHTPDERAATETQQGALTQRRHDHFQTLQRTVDVPLAARHVRQAMVLQTGRNHLEQRHV
jgi:hypothetical protein